MAYMVIWSYWSIINNFIYDKKILTILPFLFNGTLILDFKQKANVLISQPTDTFWKLPVFAYKTENSLDSVDIKEEDIYLIIKNLIPNKAHRWNDISIKIIKLYSNLSVYLQFLVEFMKGWYLIQFSTTLSKIICLL